MLATVHDDHDHEHGIFLQADGYELCVLPDVEQPSALVASASLENAGPLAALTGIPTLNSLPGATASLYLDFNGHYESNWGSYNNITIPAYDIDGNATSFSSTELANITTIWQIVAEDYAPFNINVTTVQPASFANQVAMRVAIGGDGAWYGNAGGVAYVDTFTNGIVNTVWVFPGKLGNGNPKFVGEASSHEAGHGFGLSHQSRYNGTTKIDEYYAGPGDGRAPIMGNSYDATRGVWWKGTNSQSSTTIQDDMAVIARSANGFGYRADDTGNSASLARGMNVNGTSRTASGLISTTTDLDYFSFTAGAGLATFRLTVPNHNNLDSRLEIRSADNATIFASNNPSDSFGATVTANLPAAGSYRLLARSAGRDGDVGKYTLSGTVVAVSPLVTPTALTATAVASYQVRLNWVDNSASESLHRIERSTGSTFTEIGTVGANVVTYLDRTAQPGVRYSYRVRAANTLGASAYSNTATALTSTLPQISVSTPDAVAAEPNDSAQYVFNRLGSTTNSLQIFFTVAGTATNGVDYNTIPTSITFQPGQSSVTLAIAPRDDTLNEGAENVVITLAARSTYTLDTLYTTRTVVVNDNEAMVTIAAVDATAAETITGQVVNSGQFVVTRTGSTAAAMTVNYQIGGTAVNGTDYRSLASSVIIPAGKSTAAISVTVNNDTLDEGTETVVFTLLASASYGLGTQKSATVSILDNDRGLVNDAFAGRIAIAGNSATLVGSNVGATEEAGEPDPVGITGTTSVWYSWTATQNATVTLTTQGSSFDTTLGVYTGSSVGALTRVADNDDISSGVVYSRVAFTAQAGITYQIQVNGYRSATGNLQLNLSTAATALAFDAAAAGWWLAQRSATDKALAALDRALITGGGGIWW